MRQSVLKKYHRSIFIFSGAPRARSARGRSPIRSPYTALPSAPQGHQCSISHFLASLGAQENWYCAFIIAHILHINVVINWQLSKQGIRWPASPDSIAGSGVDPSSSSIFLKLSTDKLPVLKWSQAQVQFFFKFIWKMLCLCAAQLKFWFQTDLGRENSGLKSLKQFGPYLRGFQELHLEW